MSWRRYWDEKVPESGVGERRGGRAPVWEVGGASDVFQRRWGVGPGVRGGPEVEGRVVGDLVEPGRVTIKWWKVNSPTPPRL